MTSDEAISLLMAAYGNDVEKGGRGYGRTSFRTALLMGANAIKICTKIPEIIEELEGLKRFKEKSTNETVDEAIAIVKKLFGN